MPKRIFEVALPREVKVASTHKAQSAFAAANKVLREKYANEFQQILARERTTRGMPGNPEVAKVQEQLQKAGERYDALLQRARELGVETPRKEEQ